MKKLLLIFSLRNYSLPLLFFFLFTIITVNVVHAQRVAINTDGTSPDTSAMLDIKSSSKGLLIPRVTLAQRLAMVKPAKGLLVVQTEPSDSTQDGLYINVGVPNAPYWKRINQNAPSPSVHFYYQGPTSQGFSVPLGVSRVYIELVSPGGGAGGNYVPAFPYYGGGGGGAGGYVKGYIDVKEGDGLSISIGAHGINGSNSTSPGVSATDGTDGGTVTIQKNGVTVLSISGGSLGKGATSAGTAFPGAGGTYLSADVTVMHFLVLQSGNAGENGYIITAGSLLSTGVISGSGGVSIAGDLNPFGLFPHISVIGQGAYITCNEPNYGHGGGGGAIPQNGFVDLSY